ncbi:MAG: GMP/IMP nucleotidase [Oleibacter sp.]|nr:GMP/IMP nucleotidase [Thalassolituus sp.]
MPNWQEIDTVLLDMDGTLLDLHFDNYFWLQHVPQRYAEHHGLTAEEAIAELNVHFVGLRGTLNWYCLDYWTELTGLPIAALKRDVQSRIGFRPHVRDFLMQLRAHNKRSVIVTNAHRDSVDLKMEVTGLDALVDCIISSHDYKEPKESQAFWDHLHREEAFDPKRTLLIDDSQAVLESAKQWGIGWLLTIYHPDSQQPPNTDSVFPGIHHFNELDF